MATITITPEMKAKAAEILESYGIKSGAYDLGHDLLQQVLSLSQSLRSQAGVSEAVACMAAIDELRREEGDQVSIPCDNPDFNGQPNNAVVISAGWTNWQDFRVSGHTLRQALENAVAIKATAPDDRPPTPTEAVEAEEITGTGRDGVTGKLKTVTIWDKADGSYVRFVPADARPAPIEITECTEND